MESEDGFRGRPIRERAAEPVPNEIPILPGADFVDGRVLMEEEEGVVGAGDEGVAGEDPPEACCLAAFQAASLARLAFCFSSSVCGAAGLEAPLVVVAGALDVAADALGVEAE